MYGKSFIYNNRSSTEFNLIIGGLQVIETPLTPKRTITSSSLTKYRYRTSTYGVNYDSVLTFQISLMKDPCVYSSRDELKFSRQDIREISAWLTSPITPRLFHMTDYNDSNAEEYDYFGVFTEVASGDNNIFTLNCTFESNSPFAFSAEQTVDFVGTGVVPNPSDAKEDYVYPKVIIEPTTSGSHTITITNETDGGRYMTLTNMKRGDTITIDSEKLTIKNISGSLMSFDNIDIEGLDYIYWPRLTYGNNTISVTNGAEVRFIYRYPVKVGAY